MAKAQTLLHFIGGVNKDRIGGNCSVVEHTDEKGETHRVMFDLGAIFTPVESGFVAAYPNVDAYFDRTDLKTGKVYKALSPVDALYMTHAHEDHIGALINYVKMGYVLPKIKTSGFTRNFIRLTFKKEGLPIPDIEKIKAGETVFYGPNLSVEGIDVSHSIVDSLGFYTRSYVNGKPYAAIVNNGDFLTEENMPLGHTFNKAAYLNTFKQNPAPLTLLCLDSTSTVPNGEERIGFEKAVENTLRVIQESPQCSLIISPVISRSVQNMAIDIAVARALNTKIALDGKWLQTVKEALNLSGYADFDDVLYKGTLKAYMNDKKISKKYVVCTGAFAQGLENYENNVGFDDSSPIWLSSAAKMALDLHPLIRINKQTLVIGRQRIIEEINGKTGPKMLQLMASQGAKVVISPCGRKIGNFEEVKMQDSGHINADALTHLLQDVKKLTPNMIVVPIHGNPEQCKNTKDIAESVGIQSVLAGNLETFEIQDGKLSLGKSKLSPQTWYAVKLVMPSQAPDRDIPLSGLREFWEVTEDYRPITKIAEAENVTTHKPLEHKPYQHKFEDVDLPVFEKMPKRRKMPRNIKNWKGHRER